jgi:ribosome biogenesis GTPase
MPAPIKALVLKSTGMWYTLLLPSGALVQARLKGKLKLQQSQLSNPVAVGDKVWAEPENDAENTYSITGIEERKNYIIRKSVHKNHQAHVLAANLDQALIVATIAHPVTSPGFIDRFLVTAEAYDIPACVVFNKIDLLDEDGMALLEERIADYRDAGYKVLLTSALVGEGIPQLLEQLKGKITLISGHSGVGKTSLINALAPGLALRTGDISTYSGKGKHTTTHAEMIILQENTFLIDTPGIKELGLTDMEFDNLGHYFPEIRAYMDQCRFNNCTHVHEPGCAVIAALEQGLISPSRYNSYLSMLQNDDNRR